MKVESTKDMKGLDRLAAGREEPRSQSAGGASAPADRVTLEAKQDTRQVAELLSNARLRTDSTRGARLEQLEAAIRTGAYRPDAGQLAEKLLSAAEIDAKLRALMKG